MTTVAQYLVNKLAEGGVDTIFGFPGETSLPLYIEIQRCAPRIRHVLARCPRGAGYMADGYARVSGRVGVCDVPGGIGSPFVVPAAHEANNSSVPMVILASGEPRIKRHAWTTSTCDQQRMFGAVTRKTFYASDLASLEAGLVEAFTLATGIGIGPVFIEIPADLLGEKVAQGAGESGPALSSRYPSQRPAPSRTELTMANTAIQAAKRPVILAGGGVHLSGATEALLQVATLASLPVATTLNGKGAIPENHPLALGVAGAKGHLGTNAVLEQADCILVLGSKLGDKTCNYGAFIDGTQRLVHVDRRAGEQPHRTDHYRPIRADVRAFLEALAPMLRAGDSTTRDRIELQPFWSRGPTHTLCEALSEILPDHSVLVADASVARGWAGAAVELRKRGQRLLTPAGSGSLSYALPAAIGAKIASPDSVVVAMGGDGGFSMAMHDLETAVRYRLPILFVLLNNKSLGLIDSHMTRFHGAAPLSQAFHDIDWARVVQAHGWKYIDTRETSQISDALRTAFPLEQPTLMEVRVPQEEISPDLAHTIMAQQPARRESLAVS